MTLEPSSTALILIDLQQAIVGRTLQPHAATDVVRRCADLAKVFREFNAPVVYVRVDMSNFLKLPADQPGIDPNSPPPPPEASQLVPEAGMLPGDVLITKRHWGAFEGTELEAALRKRGIATIVLGGIATNIGVESTARSAAGLGFAVVVAEDAMATFSAEAHRFAVETIFPRLGRVRSADQIKGAIGGGR